MEKPQPHASAPPASAESIALEVLRILRCAGGALITQTGLHAQLARVEWAEEKIRLLHMLLVTLLGFACVLCCLLLAGAVLLALYWDTTYRVEVALLLLALYALGALLAWRRLRRLSQRSSQAFAATREELAADIDLIRSRL